MLERKYLAHYIDASFGGTTVNYVRIGDDIEELNIEMNPDTESFKNILGESKIRHSGYEPQVDVEPYYATTGDALFNKLYEILDDRLTGDGCETTWVDVVMDETGAVQSATRENVKVVPTSFGGDTTGVQIPFNVFYNGNRTKGTFNTTSNTFTPASSG